MTYSEFKERLQSELRAFRIKYDALMAQNFATKKELADSKYNLPTASPTVKGGVRITGNDGLYMDGDTLKADSINLPTASDYEKGGVKVTGNDGLYMDGETLKADFSDYTIALGEGLYMDCGIALKPASEDEKGGVKVTGNDGLYMDGDTLKADFSGLNITLGEGLRHGDSNEGDILLNHASSHTLGGVRVPERNGLYMDGDDLQLDPSKIRIPLGEGLEHINSDGGVGLKTASDSKIGGVIVTGNDGLYMDGDTLKVTAYSNATTVAAGLMSASDKAKLNGIANNANNYALPTANDNEIGGVIVTGDDGLYMHDGELKLKTANDNEIGGVIVTGNDGLYMDGDTLKADSINLPTANDNEIGGVIVTGNDGLIMGDDNELKLDFSPFFVNGKLQIVVNGTTYTFSPDSN